MNPYKLLGVSLHATQQEIRAAYLLKVKEHHPDSPTGSDTKFKELHQAYSALKSTNPSSTFPSDPDIDFKSILKYYTKVPPNKRTSQTQYTSSPSPSPPNPASSSSSNLQGLLLLSLLLFLWSLNSPQDISEAFHSNYSANCNKIEFSLYPELISRTKQLNTNPNIYK